MQLGIKLERIKPGHPEQNGRHERFHLSLKNDILAEKTALNILQQQEFFDRYIIDFNEKRPHEALAMKYPADIYNSSSRVYPKELPTPQYPDADLKVAVTNCGSIFIPEAITHHRKERLFISESLGGQLLGLKEQEDDLWSVKFMDLQLGYLDAHEGVFHRDDL